MLKKIELSQVKNSIIPIMQWIISDDSPCDRASISHAVRISAQYLSQIAMGKSVELRVPPYIAVQCISGPRHTRGTPPNIVELDAHTWLQLVVGTLSYSAACEAGKIDASGIRCELLADFLPLFHASDVMQ